MYVLLLISLFVALLVFFKIKYAYWKNRNVPYPKPTFYFGNIGPAVLLKKSLSDIMDELYSKYQDDAYVGLYFFSSPAVLVRDINLVKDVLIKQFNNFHDNWFSVNSSVDPLLAWNPLFLKGSEWGTVRTDLRGHFSGTKLKSMIPIMQGISKDMINYINKQIKTTKSICFDVKDLTSRFTGDNVFSCVFGLDGKSFTSEVPVGVQILSQMVSVYFSTYIKQAIAFFYPFLSRIFSATVLGNPFPKILKKIIIDTVEYKERSKMKRGDFIDYLLEKKKSKKMSDDQIAGYATTAFFDAYDTGAIVFALALYELALNPDAQAKASLEAEAIFKKCQGTITPEALNECTYLENVIHETLRRHPVLSLSSRLCTKDYTFPPPAVGGKEVVIRKGTIIFIPIKSIHFDPRYYPNPDKFNPDRISGDKNERPKCTYLGFGEGPRICIGINYSVVQIKIGLIAILKEFEVRMSEKTKVPYESDFSQLLLFIKSEIYLDFCKRS